MASLLVSCAAVRNDAPALLDGNQLIGWDRRNALPLATRPPHPDFRLFRLAQAKVQAGVIRGNEA